MLASNCPDWHSQSQSNPLPVTTAPIMQASVTSSKPVMKGLGLWIEPNSRTSYAWGSMGMKSVVAWTPTLTKGGTHVRMEQSGFRSEEDANYKGAGHGWQKFTGDLERVVGGLD
jgi:uncharacterized protein YndB with AHSA1/START domain